MSYNVIILIFVHKKLANSGKFMQILLTKRKVLFS